MQWLRERLIDDWRKMHRLWSFRLALLCAALDGLYMAWPAFQGAISPVLFALIMMALALAAAVARIVKQRELR